ncbi:hypothetical protein DW886_15775 [Enterocloster aldenensis]|jgi:hypothetical protein|uniref:hypothetical protein n=1 Tax=Enterocloster aldenensis TaxID=358742 RepID=UPI000E50C184|nr:hypothetical protein DW886_15775 [Enterocloster aldenensis]
MEKKKYYRYEPYDNGYFILKEKMLYRADKNCFLTKEEAANHFENAQETALDKYEKIMNGICRLKEEVGDFTYDCDVYVHDDSGLETRMYIEFNVDGYDFRFNQ